MTTHISTVSSETYSKKNPPIVDWTFGWRYEEVRTPNGAIETRRIPLTPEEALHPKEEYIMSERTSHALIAIELRNMLRAWGAQHPEMTIFYNLIFDWNHPEIGNYAPDIAIVPNVNNPDADRGIFVVAEEGTRPCLIIEIVSPKTRSADKIDKVRDYALLGISEYIYIHSRTTRRGIVSEIVGHHLNNGVYEQIPVDEDGAVYCETISLRIGVLNGRVWVEDANTGREFLDHLETDRAFIAAEERAATAEERAATAEERATAEAEARRLTELRIAELEAKLQAIQANNATDEKMKG